VKRFRTLWSTSVAAILVAGGLTFATATPAQAATQLGGVSVQGACNVQYPGTSAVVVANNVFGWRCRTYWSGGPVDYSNINLSQQCRAQYGNGAYASYLDYNNAYSWRCYR
jgi:hypothetical protein